MKTVPLGEVLTSSASGYWGQDPQGDGADVQVVRNGDIKDDGVRWDTLPRRSLKPAEVAKSQVREGDILLTTSGDCGQVAMINDDPNQPTCATNFVRVLRFDDSVVPRYAFHYLSTQVFRAALAPFIRGTTLKNLSTREAFAVVRFPQTGVDEQRRIAAILDQADALRAKRRQVLAHLDSLTQSILDAVLRGGFERVPFGELIGDGPKNGLYLSSSNYGSGAPIVRIDSFRFGSSTVATRSLKRLRASVGQVAEFGLKPGDLLVNRVNSREHVGKTALIEELAEPTVFESNLMRIRVDRGRLLPVFAAEFMQTRDARRQVAPLVKEAINQASINQGDVRSLLIPLPPLHLQHEFARRVQRVDASRAAVQRALVGDDELFASLQSRAFRGEL